MWVSWDNEVSERGGGGLLGRRRCSGGVTIYLHSDRIPSLLVALPSLALGLSLRPFVCNARVYIHSSPSSSSFSTPAASLSPLLSCTRFCFVFFFSNFLSFFIYFVLRVSNPSDYFSKKNKRTQRFKSAVVPRPLYSPRVIVTTSIFIICIFSLFLSHFQFPCISILACKFASTLGFFTLLLQTYFMNNWCDTHMVKGFSLQEISEEGGRLVVSHFTALTFSIAERHGWSRRELHC